MSNIWFYVRLQGEKKIGTSAGEINTTSRISIAQVEYKKTMAA